MEAATLLVLPAVVTGEGAWVAVADAQQIEQARGTGRTMVASQWLATVLTVGTFISTLGFRL